LNESNSNSVASTVFCTPANADSKEINVDTDSLIVFINHLSVLAIAQAIEKAQNVLKIHVLNELAVIPFSQANNQDSH
jgi:hypothetical protein